MTKSDETTRPGDDEEPAMASTDLAPTANPRSTSTDTSTRAVRLEPGTRVEVRSRLEDQRWAKGFEVLDAQPSGYRLRRLSDGEVMPVVFAADDVRVERKRSTWWY